MSTASHPRFVPRPSRCAVFAYYKKANARRWEGLGILQPDSYSFVVLEIRVGYKDRAGDCFRSISKTMHERLLEQGYHSSKVLVFSWFSGRVEEDLSL